jgi:hypothetical protein
MMKATSGPASPQRRRDASRRSGTSAMPSHLGQREPLAVSRARLGSRINGVSLCANYGSAKSFPSPQVY